MARRLVDDARRLLERESGTIIKPHGGRLRVALAFPNSYHLGMSSLGFQHVYRLFNALPRVVCERVFVPDSPEEYRRSRTPLFTLESQTNVREFDALGFSVSFELDYPNVLHILDLAGIPLRAADRTEHDPIVLLGGPVTALNPEPLAEFVDAAVIGEAEEVVGAICEVLDEHRGDRAGCLRALARLPGVYVPSLYTVSYHPDGTVASFEASDGAPLPVKRLWVADLDAHPVSSVIRTPDTEFGEMRLVEIMRGCGRHCRFCAVGYAFLPPRFRSMAPSPGERVGLVGASVFDHPDAEAMTEQLAAQGAGFSVSSLRADTLTDELAANMVKGGQKTITIAPEAGSERLRGVINKSLTDEQVFSAVDIATRAGMHRLKLYFMLGLPTEEQADVEAMCALSERLQAEFRPKQLSLSASCFVPKPGTPFQWAGQEPLASLEAKVAFIRSRFRRSATVKVLGESPRQAVLEAVLARGDRQASSVVRAQFVSTGGSGVGHSTRGGMSGLDKRALREAAAFYAERVRPRGETFPWEIIELGVEKNYLWREWERALAGKPDPPCDVARCRRCGVCA